MTTERANSEPDARWDDSMTSFTKRLGLLAGAALDTDPDALTPREALERLYELKRLAA